MTSGNPLISRYSAPLNRFVARWDFFLLTAITIFLIRCLISVYSGFGLPGSDLNLHLIGARGILQGQTLYIDAKFEYPPLHAFFQAFWLWLLGDNPVAAKMPSLIGDIATAWLFYLIGTRRNEIFGRWLALCYLLFPLSIISSNVLGLFDSLALALMLLGILFAFRDQWTASAASIGFGVMYKFLPILAVVPMLLHLYKERRFQTSILYLGIIGIICVVIVTPFLLGNPIKAISLIFNTGVKVPDGFSIYRAFSFSDPVIPFLTQVGATITIFYVVIRKRIFELFSFEAISLFVAVFMMFNKNVYPQYFIWIFPFFAYWFILNRHSPWLTILLLFDTALFCIRTYLFTSLVEASGARIALVFQIVNWTAIGFALLYQNGENKKRVSAQHHVDQDAKGTTLYILNAGRDDESIACPKDSI